MKFLLDVNVLLAAIWTGHVQHTQAKDWLKGKAIVLCPITELGFIRISAHKKAYALPMPSIRAALQRFFEERSAAWIPANLRVLESRPENAEAVTDQYLADLAFEHDLKLATFDRGIKHQSVELIA